MMAVSTRPLCRFYCPLKAPHGFLGRTYASQAQPTLRNIGIVAHIDAGKTTTTERILHLAGHTRAPGNVDDGTSVMDFLPQERERGITIQAAAITFGWATSRGAAATAAVDAEATVSDLARITLIDTPGHIDFTFEVERTLRVLDAAVVVVDAVAGVQAQTRTVWAQAHALPKLVFINKLDRYAASGRLKATIASLDNLLARPNGSQSAGPPPVLLHIQTPLQPNAAQTEPYSIEPLDVVGDIGTDFTGATPHVRRARLALVEQLATLDDAVLSTYFDAVDQMNGNAESAAASIKPSLLRRSVAALVATRRGIPVLYGSAARGAGVAQLLDAVVAYAPSPLPCSGTKRPCAFVFKVTYDAQRAGYLAYVRVYSGVLRPRDLLINSNNRETERIQRILTLYADSSEETSSLGVGFIGVLVGLRHTRTGDTLVGMQDVQTAAVTATHAAQGGASKTSEQQEAQWISTLVGAKLEPPVPVVTRAIEAESESHLKKILAVLARFVQEDPSLRVRDDLETGQLLVSGMGELQLELVCERLQQECGGVLPVRLGPIRIAYREMLSDTLDGNTLCIDIPSQQLGSIGAPSTRVTLRADKQALAEQSCIVRVDGNCVPPPTVIDAIRHSLYAGPLHGYPMLGVCATVAYASLQSAPVAADAVAASVARALVGRTQLAEPWMRLTIEGLALRQCHGPVASDLLRRGGRIVDSDAGASGDRLVACAPLANLLGYANKLRALAAGTATLEMVLEGYERSNPNTNQKQVE